MAKKFLISTICLNRRDGLKKCLEALYQGNDPSDFDLLLTDQASSDGTGELMDEWARDKGNIRVFHQKENDGYQPPNARAFRIACKEGYEYSLFLNDDALVPANALKMLEKPFSDPLVAAVGAQGGCHALKSDFHGIGGGRIEYIEGSCLCLKVDRVRPLVGPTLFDPNIYMIYGEDSALSLFLQEKGMKIAMASFHLDHARSQTAVHGDPAVREKCRIAQEHNHSYLRKRWAHYLRHRIHTYPVLLRRKHAIGDCILTTPIIRAIRKSNPLSPIYVDTNFPQVYENNPDVKGTHRGFVDINQALVIDLNKSYENTTSTHIIDAYADTARKSLLGLGEVEYKTHLYPHEKDHLWATNMRRELCRTDEKLALIHACPTQWINKNWHPDRLAEIATWLVLNGWHVAAIGGGGKYPQVRDCINLCKKTSILQLAALCAQSQLMIGMDSGPLHIAQAMGTPTVGIFGCTNARYIMTYGSPHAFAEAHSDVECAGSRHKVTGSENVSCSTACIDSVTVDDVKGAVNRLGL